MRPGLPGDGPFNTRPSGRSSGFVHGPSSSPMSCFIASEAALNNSLEPSPAPHTPASQPPASRKHPEPSPAGSSLPGPPSPPSYSAQSLEADYDRNFVSPHTSQPNTPLMLGLSGPGSALSCSPSSYSVSSLNDDAHSAQTDSVNAALATPTNEVDEASIPQLIMPSLNVPYRRRFSDVGRMLGKMKIMVAGRAGSGKTSLIRTLAQRCDHIVHIDPFEPTIAASTVEIHASSRPYPCWPVSPDVTSSLGWKRLPSLSEVLDRNLCFVESTGSPSSMPDETWALSAYVEAQLSRLLHKHVEDEDLFALVNAGQEPVVDLILYIVPPQGLDAVDIQIIKEAQSMTNLIPVLTRADELCDDQIKQLKRNIARALADEDLQCFSFAGSELQGQQQSYVYAISTNTEDDSDVMDASLLMNSDYLPPLVPTDLSTLVDQLFSLEGAAQLRHSTAAKCLKWRREHAQSVQKRATGGPADFPRYFLDLRYRLGGAVKPRYWAPVQICNWASALRHSLHIERSSRIAPATSGSSSRTIAAAKPQGMLLDLCGEETQNRNCPSRQSKKVSQDPLGILHAGSMLFHQSVLVLKFAGSVSLAGYVMSQLMHAAYTDRPSNASMECVKSIGSVGGLVALLLGRR